MTVTRCPGHARHWFVHRGWVGTSSPTCVRYGCGAPNPNYRPDDDPYFEEVPAGDTPPSSLPAAHPIDPDCTCPVCDGPGGA